MFPWSIRGGSDSLEPNTETAKKKKKSNMNPAFLGSSMWRRIKKLGKLTSIPTEG